MQRCIKLKQYSTNDMKSNRIIILIGKRGTGKSVLMMDLLYRMSDRFDLAAETKQKFLTCLPSGMIHDRFEPKVVDSLVMLQQQNPKKRRVLLVLDDCMYDKSVMKCDSLREIFMNGRHMNITFVCCIQYLMQMPPEMRAQVDYVFALRENIRSNKKRLWEYFFGVFDSYGEFSHILDAATVNHGCLVLDNTITSTEVLQCISYFKATVEQPLFKIGSHNLFKANEKVMQRLEHNKKIEIEKDKNCVKIDF